ncbi:GrpB family protein [Methylobacterium sp. E-005]|uniref:GrpB family protein n=1 Tax=Methylobacterium sp. E-005 TaxID=2836549 RepID=UPI001FBA24C1|nr:GrpB family protein [Methylobacterium sp. E-005]MCJ2087847.1 GrpB family protein [Methylobacterium sp. E-005]
MTDDSFFRLAADCDAARAAAERLFQTVTDQLHPQLPMSAEIRHVGATAIPGCLTKGDLDMVVRVARADFAAADERLARLFARNVGSIRTDAFSAFADASRTPHLGVQLTVKGGTLDVFHHFADALRSDPALVERYNALKRAHQDWPMALYRPAKDAFIAGVLRERSLRSRGQSGLTSIQSAPSS